MQHRMVDLNTPPPSFAHHHALLDDAREIVTETLRRLDPVIALDDIVFLVMEPKLAAERGQDHVSVRLLERVLPKVSDPKRRADLQKVPAPGFVRVALFAHRDIAYLSMRVRPEVSTDAS